MQPINHQTLQGIIIAAGYGTRMGHQYSNTPKGLLLINGKPLIEHLASKILATTRIEQLTIVTNNKFFNQFNNWLIRSNHTNIKLINDGTNHNQERLGAIKDLELAINTIGAKDSLVMGSDTLFNFNFNQFINFFYQKQDDITVAYQETDIEETKKSSSVKLDSNHKLIEFIEKPQNPTSQLTNQCAYIFTAQTLSRLNEYLKDNQSDAPGYFIQWLYKIKDIYAFVFNEPLYHIGDPQAYQKAINKLTV